MKKIFVHKLGQLILPTVFCLGLFSSNDSQAQFTNVYWKPSTGLGGTGSWNSGNTYWSTNSDGSGTLSSPTTLGTSIIYNFSGTAGTVTESSSFTNAGINWLTSGYTWTSGANRTLTGVDQTSTGTNSIFITTNANLNITGTGFTFDALSMTGGAGSTLTLTNAAGATTTLTFGTSIARSGRTNSVNTIISGAGTVVLGTAGGNGLIQSGNITNNSTGNFILTNSAGGDLVVRGAVSGNGAMTLGLSSSGNIVMSNTISGNSALTLSLSGPTNGNIALMSSNSYTGGTTIQQANAGYVGIWDSASFGSGTVTIAGAGTNWVRAMGGSVNITNATVINSGSIYRLSSSNQGWKMTNSGLITGGGSILFSQADGQTLSNTNNTFGGGVNIGSSTKVYVNSIGTSGANSSLGTNGTITFSSITGSSSAGELYWMGNTNETSDKAFALNTVSSLATRGMKIYAGDNGTGGTNVTLTLNGIINSTGTNNQTITLGAFNGNTLAMNGTINQTAGYINSLVVTNSGAGTVVLGNTNNSFGGGLTINAGSGSTNTVQVSRVGNAGANSSIGTNGTINIGGSSSSGVNMLKYVGTGETSDKVINLAGASGGATLDQSGTGNLRFSSAMTATGVGAKTITLQGSGAGTGELGGAISDLGGNVISLTKSGSGTWTLSGVNTYTGLTTIGTSGIPAGTLRIGLTNGLVNGVLQGSSALANVGALDLAAGGDYVMNSYGNSANSGNNMAFTNSSGTATTLTFTNANNYISQGTTGGRTLTNASGNLTITFTGAVDIGSSTTADVAFTGPGSFILNGALNSTGSALRALTKSGDGTLTLNAASDYKGVTTVGGGTLEVGAAGALPTASAITVSSGATLRFLKSSGGINLTNLTVSSGGTLEQNLVTITSSGAVNLAGSTLKVNGSPTEPSYTLVTGNSLTGTTTLYPSIPNYQLVVSGNNVLLQRIGKVTPTIRGTLVASAIRYGQTLEQSTLSGATGSVGGTFAFTTPRVSPNVGTADQDVTFTPNDTANYNTVAMKVSVTVNPAGDTYTDVGFTAGTENDIAENGLSNLMNYALGQNGPNAPLPAPPVMNSTGSEINLYFPTARTGDTSLKFFGQWTSDLSLNDWEQVGHSTELTPPVLFYSQTIDPNEPKKFIRFKIEKQ